MIRHWYLLAALLAATAAGGQEFDGVITDRLLPDGDFFRLATCGAPPAGTCAGPVLRWPKPVVTVALLPDDGPLPAGFAEGQDQALTAAIAEINRAGAAIRIRRVDTPDADIRVLSTPLGNDETVDEVPGVSAAGIMGVGYMSYWWNDMEEITAATILISTTILPEEMPSVMLEELFQALGPRFDVEGAAYEGVSILSQSSNATTTIRDQDARLLRWLYPRRN